MGMAFKIVGVAAANPACTEQGVAGRSVSTGGVTWQMVGDHCEPWLKKLEKCNFYFDLDNFATQYGSYLHSVDFDEVPFI